MEKLSLAAFQEAIESGLKGCHVHCLGLVARSLSCWLDELAKKRKGTASKSAAKFTRAFENRRDT